MDDDEDDEAGGGNGAANSGVVGNVELPPDANGSNDELPGGGVGLGVVVGVVAVEGRGLERGEI